ncbi:phosphoribosyl-AMP cyclohydrolase [Aristophania vespae]|uniref:Phosphoribosyl-AMP cyclohydrolase n=1 Tax=Aristophania vespae TaxID=2697033 RepID=A0A6P1NGI7_9PROT|nr:phosphoribosyl-AMP cyclohydrolase [Aristophania vespae]QHI95614.1 phosphoribosyl-AMP cyclohydrolase [Aristophania vespae]UMM63281.1 Phosphoribosyl-AMP cyclohydrolase [Aristophania vespae]
MTWQAPDEMSLNSILQNVRFDQNGLIAAIAQDENKTILMLAWMNLEALKETLLTGRVCYYSRSRQTLWRKGESSGQVQKLLSAALDCDGDALLMTVMQKGVACHTGRKSCFYQEITSRGLKANTAPEIDPSELYGSEDIKR